MSRVKEVSMIHQSRVVEFSELRSFLTWLIWRTPTQKEQKIDNLRHYGVSENPQKNTFSGRDKRVPRKHQLWEL